MTLHELVTNAVKYGALSKPDARVSVNWSRRESGSLKMEWREIGGPMVTTPSQSGYGTTLIRELVAHELGGGVGLEFDPAGVRCTIEIPDKHIAKLGFALFKQRSRACP